MAGTTLAEAEAMRQLYFAALQAIAAGQSYSIGSRSLTRANLTEVQETYDKWNAEVKRLTALARGRGRTMNVVFE